VRTAYKCRAYPDYEQTSVLRRTFGCVRVVWNRTLAWRHARYHGKQARTSFTQANAYLTGMKASEDLGWLNEVSSVPLQQAIRHQQVASGNFFAGRTRYPRYKSRNGRQSAEYTRSGFRYRHGRLFLAKMSTPLAFTWSWPDIDPASTWASRNSPSPATGRRSRTRGGWHAGRGTWPGTSAGSPAAAKAPRTAPRPGRRSPAPTGRSVPAGPISCTAPPPAWSATMTSS
jgi:hypothetical protein